MSIGLLLLVAAAGASNQFPTVKNPPSWRWDTLGAMSFAHTGQALPYSPADLALLGRYPIVQFDKKELIGTMPTVDAQDRFIAAARRVRAAHPGAVQILMYLNGLIDFPEFHRLRNATEADPALLLRNAAGALVQLVNNNGVFDMRRPAMRKAFVDAALYGMASGQFNGVFIDRANWAEKCAVGTRGWDEHTCSSLVPGQRLLLAELTAALGDGNITLSKETGDAAMLDWQVTNAAMTSDTFCSSYCHGCNDSVDPASMWSSPKDSQDCADSIATIANMSARGQLSQSHGMGPFTGAFADEARAFTMAAFLIGAGNLSYFSHANWANACWELSGTKWWPELDKPLGHPTSPPNTRVPGKRWKYQRNFSSGTTVYVDVATRVVDIQWGQ